MLRKILSICALLLMPVLASAQTIISSHRGGSSRSISVEVRDSLSRDILPGAVVSITDGADSLMSVTTNDVFLSFHGVNFKKDSLTISTSLLGYKTKTGKIKIDRYSSYSIRVFLQEDPTMLNEVVVTADAVAIVIKGDTTMFNAAAFNSKQGDVLRTLLKQLPGLEVGEKTISFQGKPIDRVLVNGTNLFGKDMDSAMDMLLAEDVRSVKVYEKNAVEDTTDDDDIAKERVLDVHTKNPLEHIGQLSILPRAGIYTNKTKDAHQNWFAGSTVNLGSYTLGSRPRVSIGFEGGHNSTGLVSASSPIDRYNLDIRMGKDTPGKDGWQQALTFSSDNNKSTTGSSEYFTPSEQYFWKSRIDSTSMTNNNLSQSASYLMNWYRRTQKNFYKVDGSASFGRTVNKSSNFRSSVVDGNKSLYNKVNGDTSNVGNFRLSAVYMRNFKKRGRKLDTNMSVVASFSKGQGSRQDTTTASVLPEQAFRTLAAKDISESASAGWTEPLGKKSALAFQLKTSHTYRNLSNIWINGLTGLVDYNNTQDYIENNLQGSALARFRYGKNNDGLSINTTLGIMDVATLRTEHYSFPESGNINYVIPVLSGQISYVKGPRTMMLSYSEKEHAPSVSQLRSNIDDANPLALMSGNPSLRMPVTRNASLLYSTISDRINTNFRVSLNGSYVTNAISYATVFYDSGTYLADYDYTVLPGASLTIPINVANSFNMNAESSFQSYITKSKMTISGALRLGLSNDPYVIGTTVNNNLDEFLSLDAEIWGSPGSASFSISPRLTVGSMLNNGEKVYDYVNPLVRVFYQQRLWECVESSVHYDWSGSFTSLDKLQFSKHSLSCSVSYLFGKDKRCRLGIFGDDLLNSAKDYSIATSNLSTVYSHSTYFGRAVGVSFHFVFSRQ